MSLIQMNFFSEALNRMTSANIILPTPRRASAPLRDVPVLYLLHGMGDDHTVWLRKTGVERYALDAVLPHTDRILYDVKAADDGVHRALTGRSNAVILDNLAYCGTWQIPIEIRIPLIPGANDGEIPAIGALLAKNPVFDSVRVLPYHAYAHSKYDALGMTYPGKDYIVPTRDMMVRAVDTLRGCGLNAFSPALTD